MVTAEVEERRQDRGSLILDGGGGGGGGKTRERDEEDDDDDDYQKVRRSTDTKATLRIDLPHSRRTLSVQRVNVDFYGAE